MFSGRVELVKWVLGLHTNVNERVQKDGLDPNPPIRPPADPSKPDKYVDPATWTEEDVYEAYHGRHWREVQEMQRDSEGVEKQELAKQAAMSPEVRTAAVRGAPLISLPSPFPGQSRVSFSRIHIRTHTCPPSPTRARASIAMNTHQV